MKTVVAVPFYKKLGSNLLNLILIVFIFYVGQNILIPILFSILLATLLLPVAQFLQRVGFNRILSILCAVVGALFIISAIIYFLTSQVANFLNDMPTIESRLDVLFTAIKEWVHENFNISRQDQEDYVSETIKNIQNSEAGGIVGRTFFTVTGAISYIVFLPIYAFLILYYKDLIKQFLIDIFKNSHEEKVREVLRESLSISQLYITGLLTEVVIVFALNASGFFLLGIRYALFMGLLAALLNLIPFVGMITANVCCMLITVIYCDHLGQVPMVAVILIMVHFIDNSVILPLVVGSKVRINALVSRHA
jgi:predicted PurR-regulated permease PerM